MSVGHPIYARRRADPLVQASSGQRAAGLVVATYAGNMGRTQPTGSPGQTGITRPATRPSAMCVGAANTQNTAARGDDVVAPSVRAAHVYRFSGVCFFGTSILRNHDGAGAAV